MIKPATLWGLFKSCDNSAWLGAICRALGGQDVELDYGQKQMVSSIKTDSGWMDERIEAQRQKWRDKKRRQRGIMVEMSPMSPQKTGYIEDISPVLTFPPPSIRPSIHPSVRPESKDSLKESVSNALPPLPFEQYISIATSTMGIPEYYAYWFWNRQRGVWATTSGTPIDHTNWRSQLKAWFSREKEQDLAVKKAEWEKVNPKPVAYSEEDWELCQERCALFVGGKCTYGYSCPPQCRKTPIPPQECDGFKKRSDNA